MNQELIANMLGVRREGHEAAVKLQKFGLIPLLAWHITWSTGRAGAPLLRVLRPWSSGSTTAC